MKKIITTAVLLSIRGLIMYAIANGIKVNNSGSGGDEINLMRNDTLTDTVYVGVTSPGRA